MHPFSTSPLYAWGTYRGFVILYVCSSTHFRLCGLGVSCCLFSSQLFKNGNGYSQLAGGIEPCSGLGLAKGPCLPTILLSKFDGARTDPSCGMCGESLNPSEYHFPSLPSGASNYLFHSGTVGVIHTDITKQSIWDTVSI